MRPIPVLGALSLVALLGCQTNPDALDPLPPGTSRVETALTGAGAGATPGRGNDGLTEVVVTVAKVTAHSNVAGWVTLSEREVTIDLLRLGAYSQPLGLRTLPAGKVTQVRLYLKAEGPHYVITRDGARVALQTPSGVQSGLKLKGLVDADPCHLAALPIVFQGKKSIWVHRLGNESRYSLRPVIHLGKVESTLVGCTPGSEPLPGDPQTPTISTTDRPTPLEETPGNTVPLGPGLACGSGLACLSGTCVDGTCTPSGAGAPCNFGGDCASGLCLPDATCGDGTALPSGSACVSDAQCLSNGCVGGRCTPGSTGARCQAEADCVVGTECISGTCEPMLN